MSYTLNNKLLNSAVSDPSDCAKHVTLYSGHAAIDALVTNKYPPMSIARYSFLQLRQLSRNKVNKRADVSIRQNNDLNPGYLVWGSDALTTAPLLPTYTWYN